MATFVLVPGAGGSTWVWSRVTPLLLEDGHEAIAVDLPGDDETAGLARYAELVLDRIGARTDVVLVAGSLGGFTAPLVCERAPVRELVLVNAMVPAPGETARDWWAHTGALEAQADAARAGGYGPFELATYFLHDVDAETAAEGETDQRIEADIACDSVCDFTAWRAIGIRVLVGEDDRFFPAGLQRRVARDRLDIAVDLIPGGHLLPLWCSRAWWPTTWCERASPLTASRRRRRPHRGRPSVGRRWAAAGRAVTSAAARGVARGRVPWLPEMRCGGARSRRSAG